MRTVPANEAGPVDGRLTTATEAWTVEMAREERTEKATPKHRQRAREKGQVARSPDLGGSTVLIAGLFAISLMGPRIVECRRRHVPRNLRQDRKPRPRPERSRAQRPVALGLVHDRPGGGSGRRRLPASRALPRASPRLASSRAPMA